MARTSTPRATAQNTAATPWKQRAAPEKEVLVFAFMTPRKQRAALEELDCVFSFMAPWEQRAAPEEVVLVFSFMLQSPESRART
ncbi:MAG: hypothetical protein IJT71_01365 [Oscillospiraceae bacterium]|nr:hypothetical protein [Oscillospiraceae bacterium]